MDYTRELLFFFSALGAFNGLILSGYFLFFAKPKHISHYFLGALLLSLSIRIGKSVFFFFNPDLALIYLQLGLTACFFIGPSLYFYVKAATQPQSPTLYHWKYHYLILGIIAIGVGITYPFEGNVDLWRGEIGIIRCIYWQWLGYIIATGYLLKDTFPSFLQLKDKFHSLEGWIIGIFIGCFLIWSAYYFSSYTSYIVGALSFSFILYLMVVLFFFHKKKDVLLFKQVPKYGDKKITDMEAHLLFQRLTNLMSEKELYKNPNLKLPDVAKQLNILPHRLSQLLNDNAKKKFTQYINEYRVKAAKKALLTNSTYSLESIGYDCGFNSKSTFYAAFKKMTGTTPAKFQKMKGNLSQST